MGTKGGVQVVRRSCWPARDESQPTERGNETTTHKGETTLRRGDVGTEGEGTTLVDLGVLDSSLLVLGIERIHEVEALLVDLRAASALPPS